MQRKTKQTPEELELELQMDLLVDNELPEEDRRTLIQKCEKHMEYWRMMAIRFLERQAERTTVRDLIAGKTQENAYDVPPIYSFKLPFGIDMRTAAAVLLIAIGAGSLGMYYGQHNGSDAVASNPTLGRNTIVPAGINPGGLPIASTERREVRWDPTPLAADNASSVDALLNGQSSFEQGRSRNVFIMPHGHNQAVIVPVSDDRAQIIY